MKTLNKIILLICFNIITSLSYSQAVKIDTTFIFHSLNSDHKYYEKATSTFHIIKRILLKEKMEITEIDLPHEHQLNKTYYKLPNKIYFTSNPKKILFEFMGHIVLFDINNYGYKVINYNDKNKGLSHYDENTNLVSIDRKHYIGHDGPFGSAGRYFEYNTENEAIVSEKKAPFGYDGEDVIFSPINSKYIYHSKSKKIDVYDVEKEEVIKSYNLNCKINGNNNKTSYQATQADVDNINNKINNLEQVNIQDVNAFTKDFITDGVFNLLNSIPEWPDICSFAAQPNGNKLVVSYKYFDSPYGLNDLFVWKISDKDPTIINSEKPWTILSGHTSYPVRIIFSNDGKYMATWGSKEGILWDINTGKKISRFNEYPNEFSPDGNLLMVSKTDDSGLDEYSKKICFSFYNTSNGSLAITTDIPFKGKYFYSREEKYWNSREHATFSPDGIAYSVVLKPKSELDGKYCTEIIIVKDFNLAAIVINNKLLNNFNLTISDALLNSISKYSSEISNELEKINGADAKGEYETTVDYNQRIANTKTEPLKIISKYWIKQFDIDATNMFSVSLDSIGRFDADKNEVPVYFKGIEAKIPIIGAEAKDFKENWWKNAKIEGMIGYFNNTSIPLIQKTRIKSSANNKAYPVIITKQVFAEFMKN